MREQRACPCARGQSSAKESTACPQLHPCGLITSALVACGATAGCAGGGSGTVVSGDRALTADPATIGSVAEHVRKRPLRAHERRRPGRRPDRHLRRSPTGSRRRARRWPRRAPSPTSPGRRRSRCTAGTETQFLVRGSSGLAAGRGADHRARPATSEAWSSSLPRPLEQRRRALSEVTEIEVMFFDGITCDEFVPTHPPEPTRPRTTSLPTSGDSAPFDVVRTDQTSAIVGRAARRGEQGHRRRMRRPARFEPAPGRASSRSRSRSTTRSPIRWGASRSPPRFAFSPPLAAAAVVAAPWRDLADCPLDPAQLWLDCTIDALSPATADDPLDCVPASAPGGEGALGDAAGRSPGGPHRRRRRASRPPVAVPATPGGAVSLDAIVLGLYGSPLPARGDGAARRSRTTPRTSWTA